MTAIDLSDRELQSHALRMWANYVETRNPNLSAIDLRAQRLAVAVTEDGQKLAARLRGLADHIESQINP